MGDKQAEGPGHNKSEKNTFAAVASALLQFSFDEAAEADCTHIGGEVTSSKSAGKPRAGKKAGGAGEDKSKEALEHPECLFKVRGAATYAKDAKEKEKPKKEASKPSGGWIEQVQEALSREGKKYSGRMVWTGGDRRRLGTYSAFTNTTKRLLVDERKGIKRNGHKRSLTNSLRQQKLMQEGVRRMGWVDMDEASTSEGGSDTDCLSEDSMDSDQSSQGNDGLGGMSHCRSKRSARAGAGSKLAKLVTQEAKSLKTMEKEASESRMRAARAQRKRDKQLQKAQMSRMDAPRMALNGQQQHDVHKKLMSGSLLGLWKRRGRPPNHLKSMILQQALSEVGGSSAAMEPDDNDSDDPLYDTVPLLRRRTRSLRSSMVDTPSSSDGSGYGSEDGGDPYFGLEVEELYGCRECNYKWTGCGVCQVRDPLAIRPKSAWKPEDAHYQDVPSAPTYRPTPEEFQSPLEYINKIRPEAEKYGICMIVPPEGWSPPFEHCMNVEEFKFCAKKQLTSSLCRRTLRSLQNSGGSGGANSGGGTSRMSQMSSKSPEADDFGFHVLEEKMSLAAFQSYAEWARVGHFGGGDCQNMPELSVAQIEGEFWRIVESGSGPVEVLYGSDLDSGELGSGFPPTSWNQTAGGEGLQSQISEDFQKKVKEYAEHPWNINSWPRRRDSVLRHIPGDELITGVMVPWLYMGTCLSAFCWHVEDHHLYSVNYLHKGAQKVWYGVPGDASGDFEMAMKDALPHLFEADKNLLHRLVTLLSPMELRARGVPVHRVEHNPGSFVITFPNAYHGGFNCGWNCAEAVNFAPADWLPHGTDATAQYRVQAKPNTFSHDALLVTIAKAVSKQKADVPRNSSACTASNENSTSVGDKGSHANDDLVCMYALGELVLRIEEENSRRAIARRCGIDKELRMHSEPGGKDEQGVYTNTEDIDCDICKADLYLSAVVSCESPGVAVCPEHASSMCGSRTLLYRYTISEMQNMIDEAVEVLPNSRAYIQAAQTRIKTKRKPNVILKGPLDSSQSPSFSPNPVLGKRQDFTPLEDTVVKRPRLVQVNKGDGQSCPAASVSPTTFQESTSGVGSQGAEYGKEQVVSTLSSVPNVRHTPPVGGSPNAFSTLPLSRSGSRPSVSHQNSFEHTLADLPSAHGSVANQMTGVDHVQGLPGRYVVHHAEHSQLQSAHQSNQPIFLGEQAGSANQKQGLPNITCSIPQRTAQFRKSRLLSPEKPMRQAVKLGESTGNLGADKMDAGPRTLPVEGQTKPLDPVFSKEILGANVKTMGSCELLCAETVIHDMSSDGNSVERNADSQSELGGDGANCQPTLNPKTGDIEVLDDQKIMIGGIGEAVGKSEQKERQNPGEHHVECHNQPQSLMI